MSESLNDSKEIITKYTDDPRRLEAAVAGLSENDLNASLSGDSWSIRQIVHHLADGDEIWRIFLKQAIGNPGSIFSLEWYGQFLQDEWVKLWAYGEREIDASLALYRAGRHHIVQLLECIPEAWGKCLHVRWPNGEEQEVSVGWVVDMQCHHLDGHLDDIHKILTL
ncbi:MAG: DinB family protein [Anaerolineales bacterium]|jgi:hypothetical protein